MKKLLLLSTLLIFACKEDEDNPCIYAPTLTTEAVTDITETSATLNGAIDVYSQNCDTVENVLQGFVYSISAEPTIDDTVVSVNGPSINSNLTDLEPSTTYYVRTFLERPSLGVFYGNEVSFTLNDSNSIEGRWNFISSTDCGENDESIDSCDLESYMTLTNGIGQATISDSEDENGNIGPCEVVGSFDVSYSVGSSNQNYIFSIQGGEPMAAVVDGNTLTLTQTYDASTSDCPQQAGVISDNIVFVRD